MSDWWPYGVTEEGDFVERRYRRDVELTDYRVLRGKVFAMQAVDRSTDKALNKNPKLFVQMIRKLRDAL